MKSALMIAIIVLSASAGDLLMTRTMKQSGEVERGRIWTVAKRVLTNKNFALSLILMAIAFFSFLAILSWENVSFIIPATSLEYVISTLGARFVLKERITPLRWMGTLLVCVGVAMISLR